MVPHEAPIPYPTFSEEVAYAGKLVAVLDEECHDFTPEGAAEHVHGYTIMNDVDVLDQPDLPSRNVFDGSRPLGPCLATDIDLKGMEMYTDINGERRQEAPGTIEPGDEIVIHYEGIGILRNTVVPPSR